MSKQKIIECVANFSEGARPEVISEVAAQVEKDEVEGVKLLHIDSNAQANRTVLTFAGHPEAVLQAALRVAEAVFFHIDMRVQEGEHPRLGALDVCPFVPLYNSTIEECDVIANKFAETLSQKFKLPVYLYRDSARQVERKKLAYIRKGEYEKLPHKLANQDWRPDFGLAIHNPQLGASIVGARPILVAWNINIAAPEIAPVKKLALKVRTRFASVRAIAWSMEQEFACFQISCNLEDLNEAGVFEVFEFCQLATKGSAAQVLGSELIGLAPSRAFFRSLGQDIQGQEIWTKLSKKRLLSHIGLEKLSDHRLLEPKLREHFPETFPENFWL